MKLYHEADENKSINYLNRLLNHASVLSEPALLLILGINILT